ncbi:hypothetical protein ES706_01405 [subsurface metagenome]
MLENWQSFYTKNFKGGKMIIRSKVAKFVLIGVTLLAGVLIFTSCVPTTVTEPVTEPERMPPAVLVIPNVIEAEPKVKIDIVGANFEPGEEVRISIMFAPGCESTPGAEGEGLALEVDELGSFCMKGQSITPRNIMPGVYPVRVYDKDGKVIASTLILVEEPE